MDLLRVTPSMCLYANTFLIMPDVELVFEKRKLIIWKFKELYRLNLW